MCRAQLSESAGQTAVIDPKRKVVATDLMSRIVRCVARKDQN
jgi:hypothetical protein